MGQCVCIGPGEHIVRAAGACTTRACRRQRWCSWEKSVVEKGWAIPLFRRSYIFFLLSKSLPGWLFWLGLCCKLASSKLALVYSRIQCPDCLPELII